MSAPASPRPASRRCGSAAPRIRCCCRRSATRASTSRASSSRCRCSGRPRSTSTSRSRRSSSRCSRARCSRSRSPSAASACSCGPRARSSPGTASRSCSASRAPSTATGGACTAGGSSPGRPRSRLLSKYVIAFRGRHVFNPSNFGLVLCFLLLGPERADPLAFWWGPMSVWLAIALVLIVGGGLAILRRLRLVVDRGRLLADVRRRDRRPRRERATR